MTPDAQDKGSEKFERLKALLQTLFQIDQPDLDFGIYRIMHAKSAEVAEFLGTSLLPQVRAAFEQYRPAEKGLLESQLAKAIAQVVGTFSAQDLTVLLDVDTGASFDGKRVHRQVLSEDPSLFPARARRFYCTH